MPTSPTVSLALIGVGHLGKIYAKCIAVLSAQISVVGAHETDFATAQQVAKRYSWQAFAKTEDLDAALDEASVTGPNRARAVEIVTPTTMHYVLTKAAIAKDCLVFVEKPIASIAAEGSELERLATQAGRVFQVGHVERFNPAFRHVAEHGIKPVFNEAQRLEQLNPRALDVLVVLDRMIHNIDLVLSLADAELEHVSASGVGVVGDAVDFASARLDFAGGTIANLTASQVSLKNMRKLRHFAHDAYVGIDLINKEAEIVMLSDHDPAAPGAFQPPHHQNRTRRRPRRSLGRGRAPGTGAGRAHPRRYGRPGLAVARKHRVMNGTLLTRARKSAYAILAVSTVVGLTACTPEEIQVFYLEIPEVSVATGAGGAVESDGIVALRVVRGSTSLGFYPVPAVVPVLGESADQIAIEPVVRRSGESEKLRVYPLYAPIVTTLNSPVGGVTTLRPVFEYREEVVVGFSESFETSSSALVFDLTPEGSAPLMQATSDGDVRDGEGSGTFTLTAETPLYEVASTVIRPNRDAILDLWVELDYRGEGVLAVALIPETPVARAAGEPLSARYFQGALPRGEWTKVYFDIVDSSNQTFLTGGFRVSLLAIYDEGLGPEQAFFLDNLRVVYR